MKCSSVKVLLKETSVNRPRSIFLKETVSLRKTRKRRVNNRGKRKNKEQRVLARSDNNNREVKKIKD